MPVVSTNTAANSALVNLNRNSSSQENFLRQLSSGSRINSSSDDAAGLAVSNQLLADITVLEQSARNAGQAEALLQTADGALSRQSDILQRMKALATQYNSGTVDSDSRDFINAEYEELIKQLDLIVDSTSFNGNKLLDGTYDQRFVLGIEGTDFIDVNLTTFATDSTTLRLSSALSLTQYNSTKADVERADGTDITAATQVQDLTAGSDVAVAGGTFIIGDFDQNGDGDVTDNNDIATATVTIAATDTIQDILDGINAITTVGGDQVFDARLDNGQIVVDINDGQFIDRDGDGDADAAFALSGTLFSSTVNSLTSGEVFDNLRTIDYAIQEVSDARSTIGAFTSGVRYQGENIETQIEKLAAARSTIVDADIAESQTNFTNAQVLTEAATAALAQANDLKTSLLQLLS